MYRIYNLKSSDNVEVSAELGPFTVITHLRNLAPNPENRPGAIMESYYAGLLMDRKRQLICQLNQSAVLVAAGMMQWMVGDCKMVSDANGLFGYLGKQIRGKTTGQNCIAPKYSGSGTLVLEPVDEDIMLVNLQDWQEGIVIEKGLFLACSADVQQSTVMRSNVSSTALGNEGLFSMALKGQGFAALRVPCPKETLVLIELEDDVLKVDGNFAIAWSSTLGFTVENSGKTVVSTALSGEGFVNTFKGTGKILLAPYLSFGTKEVEKSTDNA